MKSVILGDARVPDEQLSITGSLRRSAAEQCRLRSLLNVERDNGRHKNGEDKQTRAVSVKLWCPTKDQVILGSRFSEFFREIKD